MTPLPFDYERCPTCSGGLPTGWLSALRDRGARRAARTVLGWSIRLAGVLAGGMVVRSLSGGVLLICAGVLALLAVGSVVVLIGTPSELERAGDRHWQERLAESSPPLSVSRRDQVETPFPFDTAGRTAGREGFRFSREAR
jgi:hypothetical protein